LSILIDDVVQASLNIATTTLRAVISDIPLDDVLAKRGTINDQLRLKLDEIRRAVGAEDYQRRNPEIEPPVKCRKP
jgi:regulator of protease activity HflC (stomatin/prohibitin superfamily)